MHSRFRIHFALSIAASALLAAATLPSFAQKSPEAHWAEPSDSTAKELIDQERKWAEFACQPSDVIKDALADDFVGTSPEGSRYTKKDALEEHRPPSGTVKNCKLIDARVRFFAPGLAVVYGRESSVHKDPHGKEFERVLIWTDTWLKRNGKWQIITVQDMPAPRP